MTAGATHAEFCAGMTDQLVGCRLQHHPGPLLSGICQRLLDVAPSLTEKQLVLVAWSLAKVQDTPNADSGEQQLPCCSVSMTCLLMASTCCSRCMDTVDANAGALLDAIAAASVRRVPKFSSQGLTNLVWSYGRLQHPADELLAAMAPQAAARMPEFKAQGLCNLLYGYRELHRPLGPDLSAAAIRAVSDRFAGLFWHLDFSF